MMKLTDYDAIKKSVKNDVHVAFGVMQMVAVTGCSWQEIVASMGFEPIENPNVIEIGDAIKVDEINRLKQNTFDIMKFNPENSHVEKVCLCVGVGHRMYKHVQKLLDKEKEENREQDNDD